MDIITLNERIENFVQKHDLSHDALVLKQEHAIAKSEEWQRILDELAKKGRILRVGIIGRVKSGKSSMLNALLFNGNDILPKAATPMTAALTVMEYGKTVRAEVDFFTQKDIDEIQDKYQKYCSQLDELIRNNEKELLDRAVEEKKSRINGIRFDKALAEPRLTAQEQQECREKAERRAKREMNKTPISAAYDHYEHIQATGKSLSDLEEYKTINVGSVEELMNGELNKFVGADGAFMPFTKSITLYIPESSLQGLQIIDTPGINDPVTSRGVRTEELLAECDVVLIVSPAGQFLSSEDTDLLYRVTTKEGTQQAYIIASQADSQLFGNEYRDLPTPNTVLQKISDILTKQARDVLQKQIGQYSEMKAVADKLNANPVVCISSAAYSLLQRYDTKNTWDANLQHVWKQLTDKFPDTFNHDELAKNALSQMGNIDKLHQIVEEVRANKKEILKKRRIDFENSKRKALQAYLKDWEKYIGDQVYQIQTADVDELRKQQTIITKQQSAIKIRVGGVYDDLVDDIKLNLDKQLKDKLSSTIRQYEETSKGAKGSETETYQRRVKRGGFFGTIADFFDDGKLVTRTRTYATVQATPIRCALEAGRHDLEDKLRYIAETYSQAWKKKIYNQVVGALREAMDDEELDITIIVRAVKNVLVRIPEASFAFAEDIPDSLKKSGVLKGYEAESYIRQADEYISNLRHTVRTEISAYMSTLVGNLKNVDLPKDLTGDLAARMQQLVHELENKEASLYRYQSMQKELLALQQEADI